MQAMLDYTQYRCLSALIVAYWRLLRSVKFLQTILDGDKLKLLFLIVNYIQSSLITIIASFSITSTILLLRHRTLIFYMPASNSRLQMNDFFLSSFLSTGQMPGIDWLESQTTNGLNCSHFACFLRNSAYYYPLLHAAAPPDLLFQLCKWQKSEIIVLLSPRDTQLSTAAHPRHRGA